MMTDDIDWDAVVKNKVFLGLSKRTVSGLLQDCESVDLEPGEYLFRQGSQSDAMYIVVRGSLSVIIDTIYPDRSKDNSKVASIYQGSVIGEMCFLGVNKRVADIIAEDASHLIRFPADKFNQGVADKKSVYFQMGYNIAKILAGRLTKANDLLSSSPPSDALGKQQVITYNELLF